MQALALGHLDSLATGRAIVRTSFPLKIYDPVDRSRWDAAYALFLQLVG